jgi:hypothetical protein
MSDIPHAAIDAAMTAIATRHGVLARGYEDRYVRQCLADVVAVLEAAASHIAAAERQRLFSAQPDRETAFAEWLAGLISATGNSLSKCDPDDLAHEAYCQGWTAAAAAECSARVAEQDAIRADLGDLLEATGLGDYARPESSHEVMQQAITEVRRIRSQAATDERQRWATRFREMAAAVLPQVGPGPGGISVTELAKRNPDEPGQVQGRLLLNLADMLDPAKVAAPAAQDQVAALPPVDGEPLTHFFHCWRFSLHHACAVALIERQALENDALLMAESAKINAAVAAERERCAHLAELVDAEYVDADPCRCGSPGCRGPIRNAHAWFADLLRNQP